MGTNTLQPRDQYTGQTPGETIMQETVPGWAGAREETSPLNQQHSLGVTRRRKRVIRNVARASCPSQAGNRPHSGPGYQAWRAGHGNSYMYLITRVTKLSSPFPSLFWIKITSLASAPGLHGCSVTFHSLLLLAVGKVRPGNSKRPNISRITVTVFLTVMKYRAKSCAAILLAVKFLPRSTGKATAPSS
ncbi:hypothetical protein ElyMa_005840600 [Elysia marginata]|uniref:Uncharacterized protein n=1 Tax=Elysia marginata TaxID=1093978 RepID=A0AAV4FXB6_9GAST|nr:hypothetical protein ElyMa_005840600 [Elysia marginata]